MAHTLAELARVLGWRAERLDWADFSAGAVSELSMVVVATQGNGDEESLEQAVAARPAYIGLVGSRKRGTAVLGYLAERGVPQDQLDRVTVPAGLDLGKTAHTEIAVSILAELVQLRASGQIAAVGVSAPATVAEAIDPVCGMTVATIAANRPLTHEGVTYYFCGAGCRHHFESDPASYARNETRC
jgi:xanthine dehydrogenase accessory factor